MSSAFAHSPARILHAASFIRASGNENSANASAESVRHAFLHLKRRSSSISRPGATVIPSGIGRDATSSSRNARAACEPGFTRTGMADVRMTASRLPVGDEYAKERDGNVTSPSFTGRTL